MKRLLLLLIIVFVSCSNNNVSSGTEIGNAFVSGIIYDNNNLPAKKVKVEILTSSQIPDLIKNIETDTLGCFTFEIEMNQHINLFIDSGSIASVVESLIISEKEVSLDPIYLHKTGSASLNISDSIYNDSGFIYLSGTLIHKSVNEAIIVDDQWILSFDNLPIDTDATFTYKKDEEPEKYISGSFSIESDMNTDVLSDIFWRIYPSPQESVIDFTSDLEGNLWWGSAQTIYKFNNSMVDQIFSSNQEFPFDTLTTLACGNDGTIWIGTQTGQIAYIKGSLKHTLNEQPFNGAVNSVQTSSDNGLWFATEEEGLFRFKNASWDSINSVSTDLISNCIKKVINDKSGGVFFYNQENQLFHCDSNLTLTSFNLDENILDLTFTSDEILWILTDSIIYNVNKELGINEFIDANIEEVNFNRIESVNTDIWLSSSNSLYLLRDGKYFNINWQGSPFKGNQIYKIESYGTINLWLYTDAGLFEIYFNQ